MKLAPPSCLRREDSNTGGRDGWLTAYPDALKKASDRVRARRLVKRLAMAKVKDGEFRAMLGCRRSGRLSSPATHAPAALGKGRSTDLMPIEEDLESEGVRDTDGTVSVDLKLAQQDDDSDDSGVLLRAQVLGDGTDDSCPNPDPLLPFTGEAMDEAGAHGCVGDSLAAISEQVPAAVSGDIQVFSSLTEEPLVEAVAPGGDGGSQTDTSALLPGDVFDDSQMRLTCTQVEPACLEDNPTGMANLGMNSSVVVGGERGQVGGDVPSPRLSAGLGDNGMMESGQPGTVVEGVALRLPSTDGRQQRPLMPAVSSYPVSGVGQDGHGGSEVFPVGCGEGVSLGDGDRALAEEPTSRPGGGSLGFGDASRFAPLTKLDEDPVVDGSGDWRDLGHEGHRTASSCVDALLAVSEEDGDGGEGTRGGKKRGLCDLVLVYVP
ncbi:hypothetical protein Dimus_026794 [Dionaea muscipula]